MSTLPKTATPSFHMLAKPTGPPRPGRAAALDLAEWVALCANMNEQVWAADGSVLEALFRRLDSLKECPAVRSPGHRLPHR